MSHEDDTRLPIPIESTYRRYGPMVLRRCRFMLKDEENARDAMHDVFVSLLVNEDRLDDRALSSLLFRMATHVCLNRIRSATRRKESPGDTILERIACAGDSDEHLGARSLLRRLFRHQQPSSQVIAMLYHVDGMTHAEVADEVGMSVSGVRKRLRNLRTELAELAELAELEPER
ncbi:MAG TPA: sigma-70 family RNA polymerase sigma factor [Kofleriaceae bacterium]|nr:sigma-70 family RNA polymerase sigma factor [Kofleriaceae bacterium]